MLSGGLERNKRWKGINQYIKILSVIIKNKGDFNGNQEIVEQNLSKHGMEGKTKENVSDGHWVTPTTSVH